MTKRPLVNAEPVDDFGSLTSAEGWNDPASVDRDFTYIPGFSEQRRERDIAYSEYVQGRRLGQDVPTLSHNVRLVRRVRVKDGTPDSGRLMSASNSGYAPVTKKDIGQPWFKAMPPGARELPTGEIVNAAGDLQYMVATADRVRVNRKRSQDAALAQVEGAREQRDGLLEVGSKVRGADPTFDKETKAK